MSLSFSRTGSLYLFKTKKRGHKCHVLCVCLSSRDRYGASPPPLSSSPAPFCSPLPVCLPFSQIQPVVHICFLWNTVITGSPPSPSLSRGKHKGRRCHHLILRLPRVLPGITERERERESSCVVVFGTQRSNSDFTLFHPLTPLPRFRKGPPASTVIPFAHPFRLGSRVLPPPSLCSHFSVFIR